MNKIVHVIGRVAPYERMFKEAGWEVVDSPFDADFIQFTGGADVYPGLYGQKIHPRTYYNKARDEEDRLFYDALKAHQVALGICRGAQFLNVMNGGDLWQDVDGHAIGGTHPAIDLQTSRRIEVTSTHHQMMRPNLRKGHVLCVAGRSTKREDDKIVDEFLNYDDVEVVYYPGCLCFQPHPEHMGAGECRDYYFELIEELFFND